MVSKRRVSTVQRRKNALGKLGRPFAGGKSGYVYAKTAASLLGITEKALRSFLEPVEVVPNPHYTSAPEASLWDPVDLLRISKQKRVDAARARKGPKPKHDFAPTFRNRYPSIVDAIPTATEALWSLNRYAKHETCTKAHRKNIYDLKNRFVEVLAICGHLVSVGEHVQHKPARQLECWGCWGMGCERCDFTGVWRELPAIDLVFVVLNYNVSGQDYSFHQPKESLRWEALKMAPRIDSDNWEPQYDQPIKLKPSKFSEAKALIAWVCEHYEGQRATAPDAA